MVFTQNYDQLAVNNIGPGVLSPFIPFPVANTSPQAALDDTGVGIYGQGTFAFSDRMDLSIGARFDHENRKADLLTAYDPMIAPPVTVNEERSFSDVSPQFAAAFKVRTDMIAYGTVSRAFKAGGFNPVSLPGSESYGEEHAGTYEGGLEDVLASGRFSASLSAFLIRLGRPAAEPADWAGPVLHLKHWRGHEPRCRIENSPAVLLTDWIFSAGVGWTQRAVRRWDVGWGCGRVGPGHTEHAVLYRELRRDAFPQPERRRPRLRPRGRRLDRQVLLRRSEHGEPGQLRHHELPRRLEGQGTGAWKAGSATHSTRTTCPLAFAFPGFHALRLPGRAGPAPDDGLSVGIGF
jgi:hypothetical protein